MIERKSPFISLVSTGINDNKIKNLEISLPFYYILYSKNKPLHLSFKGEICTIHKGQLVFIKKSTPFSVLLDWGKYENALMRDDIVSLKIPHDAIVDYCKNYTPQEHSFFMTSQSVDFVKISFSDNKESLALISNIIETSKSLLCNDCAYTKVEEVKYMLILSLINSANHNVQSMLLSSSSMTISDKVAKLVMSNYEKNWNNNELASELNMSVSTFKKKMYKDIGTVRNFITEIKMVEALRQLRRTDKPVNIIAMSLGFNSASYFTSVFKKHFKIFPTDVRRNDNTK